MKGVVDMEAKARLRYARISPRKVSIVLNLIRNKPIEYAMAILKNTPKAACEYLIKLLNSAIANAVNNNQMDASKLYVSECFVCPGPILKRIRYNDDNGQEQKCEHVPSDKPSI